MVEKAYSEKSEVSLAGNKTARVSPDKQKSEQAIKPNKAFATQKEVDAAVIICAYTLDRWQDLVDAVNSIINQPVIPRELIVVIDHNPELFDRARHAFSGVKVLENRQERGLSGARNTGIAEANGEIVVFMDEDALAEPGWLKALLEPYQNPIVAGVGGRIDPWWLSGKPAWFPEEFQWVVGCTYLGMPAKTAPVRNLIGANMSFRKEVFQMVGGFTNGMGRIGTLPVGCEETELCIRHAQKNADTLFLFEPRAVVRHRVPRSRISLRYFLSRCFSEGRSKAQVARSVGSQQGLASERTYTLRVLPQGVIRGIKDALRGDPSGLGRAAAIVTGLLFTSAGYLSGRLTEK